MCDCEVRPNGCSLLWLSVFAFSSVFQRMLRVFPVFQLSKSEKIAAFVKNLGTLSINRMWSHPHRDGDTMHWIMSNLDVEVVFVKFRERTIFGHPFQWVFWFEIELALFIIYCKFDIRIALLYNAWANTYSKC